VTEIICMDVHHPHAKPTRIVMDLNAEMACVLMNSPREVIKLVDLKTFLSSPNFRTFWFCMR